MLDIKRIREDFEGVKAAVERRCKGDFGLSRVPELDAQRREVLAKVEQMKNRQNTVSKEIPKLKKAGEDTTAIMAEMKELATKRNTKQPVTYPSAGSTFKRPEGYFAGKLVEDAGLKGVSVGGAEVSTLHSGFIINKGGATATDILELIALVQNRVYDEFGVELKPEVRIIG